MVVVVGSLLLLPLPSATVGTRRKLLAQHEPTRQDQEEEKEANSTVITTHLSSSRMSGPRWGGLGNNVISVVVPLQYPLVTH